jgi:hypothetical protein
MEIWIIGGAIVALMIYVSTRIKRSAATAYEREIVETAEFSIVKPEGFINPIESKFAFEAYTKDFGTSEESEEFRQAWASVEIIDSAGNNVVAAHEIVGKEVPIKVWRKTIVGAKYHYELQISVLEENEHEYLERINLMFESFTFKPLDAEDLEYL